ncbi:MAG TPA: DUF2147 domain-containing protein [Steroidobacteraceae bacterium]|nr:DUF2147 domain-containing protein [Steroidobacteraceae bacterium]
MSRLAVLCVLLGMFAGADAEDLFGEWWTPGFNARVLIYPCAEKACGKITWLWEETPNDIADRKPLVGRMIFSGLERGSHDTWDGRIYNPEDGRSYTSHVGLISIDELEVSGCVLMFCKRQVWRRFDALQCPPVAPESSQISSSP